MRYTVFAGLIAVLLVPMAFASTAAASPTGYPCAAAPYDLELTLPS